jgi:radical SAM protein with 4Fe4S-binding SPASM domain
VSYLLFTNGTLLAEDVIEFLASHQFEMYLSFDGVPGAQHQRGEGTFEFLDSLLDRLSSVAPRWFREKVSLNMALTSQNMKHMADSVDYFLSKRVSGIVVSPVITHDAGWKVDNIISLERQMERVFESSKRHYSRTGKVPLSLFKKTVPDDPSPVEDGSLCRATRGSSLTVDVDGQVYSCTTFAGSYQRLPEYLDRQLSALRLGHISDEGLPERLADYPEAARRAPIFFDKQRKYSAYGRCSECPHSVGCFVCPVSIGHIPGNTDPHRIPGFQCAFNRVVLKYREKFPRQPTAKEILTGKAVVPELVQEFTERTSQTGARPGSR